MQSEAKQASQEWKQALISRVEALVTRALASQPGRGKIWMCKAHDSEKKTKQVHLGCLASPGKWSRKKELAKQAACLATTFDKKSQMFSGDDSSDNNLNAFNLRDINCNDMDKLKNDGDDEFHC